jgi:enamine deaminase RidA (YjgF/YER057c/UK114 family)
METNAKMQIISGAGSPAASTERRLKGLSINPPAPPRPFGDYVEAVQTGNLLFLSGMLPTAGSSAKFIAGVGRELDIEAGRKAANLAALNALAVAATLGIARQVRVLDLPIVVPWQTPLLVEKGKSHVTRV